MFNKSHPILSITAFHGRGTANCRRAPLRSVSVLVLLMVAALSMLGASALAQMNTASERKAPLPKAFGEPQSVRVAPPMGALSDHIPIVVPPGRRNVEPKLSLNYSSLAGLGIVGYGWHLQIGKVECWRGDGTPPAENRNEFSYTISGAGGRLVETDGGVFRAETEGVYRPFTQVDADDDGKCDYWEMYSGEGVLHRFGGTPSSRIDGKLWLLDYVEDRSGNTITFSYRREDGTLYPSEIWYTGYAPAKDSGANSIVFEYEERPDVRLSYSYSTREVKSLRLRRISAHAGDSLVRRYEFAYRESPVNYRSLLDSIYLVGADDISRVTLRSLEYRSRPLGWSPQETNLPLNLVSDSGKETGVQIADVNGDGFADAIGNGDAVYLGDGLGNFQYHHSWSDSLTAANVKFIRTDDSQCEGADNGVRLIDVNSDGRADLFIAQHDLREIWLNTGSGWSRDSEWTASLDSLKAQAATDSSYLDATLPYFETSDIVDLVSLAAKLHERTDSVSAFLWSRLSDSTKVLVSVFDNTGSHGPELRDSLVEDLNLIIDGPSIYDSVRFAGVTLSATTDTLRQHQQELDDDWLLRLNRLLLEDAYPDEIQRCLSAPDLSDPYEDEVFALVENECDPKGVELTDVNGDGRLDILWSLDRRDYLYYRHQRIPVWLRTVFLNTGTGWDTSGVLSSALYPFGFIEDSQIEGYGVMDVNGDGLGDIVRTLADSQAVYLATGTGWQYDPAYSNSLRYNDICSIDSDRIGQGLMPIDFNDDNLVDFLRADDSVTAAFRNTGTEWVASPEMTSILEDLGVQFNEGDSGDATGVVLADVDGDGIADVIRSVEGELPQLWLSSSIRSDLLVRVTSALGEVTEAEWALSTDFDNSYIDTSGVTLEGMPNPMPVVTALTRYDGRNRTDITSFEYAGGRFCDRQFRGFGWVKQPLPNGGRSETWYRQEAGLAGQLDVEKCYDAENRLRTRRSSKYDIVQVAPQVKQIRLVQVDQSTIEPSGNICSRTTIYTYDDRLNCTSVYRDPDLATSGDEVTMSYSWARNDDLGIWSVPARIRTLGPDSSLMAETIILYDELSEGLADRCLPSEVRELVEPGVYVSKYMAYDEYGNVSRVRDRTGNVTLVEYDYATATFRTRAVDPEGRIFRSVYDQRFGELIRDVDASGNVSRRSYDAFGRLTRVFLPGDETSPFGTRTITYSPLGDPNSQFFHVAETELPGDSGTLETTRFFDGMGLIYRVEREGPADRKVITRTEFDEKGNPVRTSRPFYEGDTPAWSVIERDFLHRPVSIVEPDSLELTVTYVGPGVDIVDRRGITTSFRLNGDAKVTDIRQWVDGVEQVTKYTYDALGRLTGVVDALGEETHITYDGLGRRVRLEDPNAGTFSYEYDGEGRLTKQTAPDRRITRFEYNRAGDLLRKIFPDQTVVSFTYGTAGRVNAVGRITRIVDAAGTVDLEYDVRGNVIERKRRILECTYVTGYAYGSRGQLLRVWYPDGFTVDYEYDAAGNLVCLTDGQGRALAKGEGYSAAGQLHELEFGNGVHSSFAYDRLLRMTSIRTLTAAEELLQDLEYAYDPDGNLLSIIDGISDTSQTFQYDELSRLVGASGPYGDEVYEYDAIGNLLRKGNMFFTVDQDHPQRVIAAVDSAAGPGGTGSGGYNKSHEQGTMGRGKNHSHGVRELQLDYDLLGNVVRKGDQSFEYNAENQLIRVLDARGKVTQENVYGAGGQRVILRTPQSTTVFIDGIYEENNTHASRHVRMGPLLVSTVMTPRATVRLIRDVDHDRLGLTGGLAGDSSDFGMLVGLALLIVIQISSRTRLRDRLRTVLSGVGGAVRRRPHAAIIILLVIPALLNATIPQPVFGQKLPPDQPRSEKRYYYHSNHLGSVNVVTDDRAKVIERRDYKPYGEGFEWTGPRSGPRELLLTFGGHRYDDATGLYYFGARHYDAELGRFLTADTQVPDPENPKTLHRYAYAGGNPIRYSDPTGHGWFDWLIGILVVVAAIVIAAVILVATFGTGTPPLVAGLICLTLGGAFLSAGVFGAVALARNMSPLSPDFWQWVGAGFVFAAMVGAGLVSLVMSAGASSGLLASIAVGMVSGMIWGAVFAGAATAARHFAKGGSIEGLLGALFTEKALVSAGLAAIVGLVAGGVFGGLVKGAQGFTQTLMKVAKHTFRFVGGGMPVLVGGLTGRSIPFWLTGPDIDWYYDSPRRSVGIPAWATAGTWPGMARSRGQSETAEMLVTMPLAL